MSYIIIWFYFFYRAQEQLNFSYCFEVIVVELEATLGSAQESGD